MPKVNLKVSNNIQSTVYITSCEYVILVCTGIYVNDFQAHVHLLYSIDIFAKPRANSSIL